MLVLLEAGARAGVDTYHAPTLLSFNIVLPALYVLYFVSMQAFVDQDPICLRGRGQQRAAQSFCLMKYSACFHAAK